MKTKFIFSIILGVLLSPFSVHAKLNVVTTTTDLAAIAREIGGDKVDVKSIARGNEDPHYLEAKPSYVVTVNRADLLIEIGLQLEAGWLPVLITQSRNPKIQPGMPGRLDASEAVHLLEIPTGAIDRSMGDVHPDGNPHYWLDPHNGLMIGQKIADHLIALDSENQSYYEHQLRTFQTYLNGKIQHWEKKAAPLKGKKVVPYHKVFNYLTHWVGLEEVGYIEPKPGIPPSPAHILNLIGLMTAQQVPFILSTPFYDPKASRDVATKTGAKLLVLPSSVGGVDGVTTYDGLFEYILHQLGVAL